MSSDAISIQLALGYCRTFGEDFRFISSFVSVRLTFLAGISVYVDEYPLSGEQLVRIYDLQAGLNTLVLEEKDDRTFHKRKFL